MLLKKLRPSRWIAILMFGWGACSTGLAGAHNYGAVTGVRFLLGVFEAGLFVCKMCSSCCIVLHPQRLLRKLSHCAQCHIVNTL